MSNRIVWEGNTDVEHYQVVDTLYDSRPARVLYSGNRQAAQSGVATDDNPDLLFDYNQRMFELVKSLAPESILLIGGAVGTLVTALMKALPDIRIDMVEPDKGLTDLGYKYFDLPVDERLQIFHTDGRSFLREYATRYDMVLVDAFLHTTIPRDLKTLEAFEAYYKHLKPKGILSINVISGYYGPSAHVLKAMSAAAHDVFKTVDVFLASRGYSLWLPQNFVLTAQKQTDWPLKDYMRYDSVQSPEVSANDVLRDN